MPAKKKPTDTFETHLASLEEIVEALESGELDLETAMTRYEEGVKRLRTCYGMLKGAEQRVRKLVGEAGETPGETEPFEEEGA